MRSGEDSEGLHKDERADRSTPSLQRTGILTQSFKETGLVILLRISFMVSSM
jgi:hypothetical protein